MIIAVVPLIVVILGALVFALAKDKVSEMGRLMFFVGLLWLVYTLATKTVHLG